MPSKNDTNKKIVYIDMDGVLVDFESGVKYETLHAPFMDIQLYQDRWEDYPGIFARMNPMPGAIDAFMRLAANPQLDVYILSTAPWDNESAWLDKIRWVKRYLGDAAKKRLILSHHKNLNIGDFLIDDRLKHGVPDFQGKHIHFGQAPFETWNKVVTYLEQNI